MRFFMIRPLPTRTDWAAVPGSEGAGGVSSTGIAIRTERHNGVQQ